MLPRPIAIPCRYADIVQYDVTGNIISLTLKMGKYAFTNNLNSFNSELSQYTSNFPNWPDIKNKEIIEGYFCEPITNHLTNISPSSRTRDWQDIVSEVQSAFIGQGFDDYEYFYQVKSLIIEKNNTALTPVNGRFNLNPDTDYKIKIIHYSPEAQFKYIERHSNPRLFIYSYDKDIINNTRDVYDIDSPYDALDFRFNSGFKTAKRNSLYTMYFLPANVPKINPEHGELDIDIPLTINRNTFKICVLYLLGVVIFYIQQRFNTDNPFDLLSQDSFFQAVFSFAFIAVVAFGFKKIW